MEAQESKRDSLHDRSKIVMLSRSLVELQHLKPALSSVKCRFQSGAQTVAGVPHVDSVLGSHRVSATIAKRQWVTVRLNQWTV